MILKKVEADKKMESYRSEYKEWRNAKKKDGFFIIYNSFLENELLKNINGNALKLYIYLGIHSKNDTGESWHSLQRISEYFGKDSRTIKRWFKELENIGLVSRVQKGLRVPNTFIRKYGNKKPSEELLPEQEKINPT
ncbi:MAG: helix-turn-helix domain-containing protein [Fusobacteriaceae bacterium]|nr:helix-turn-helix domain-containing protein [Fusobacteriaceae bacterium]